MSIQSVPIRATISFGGLSVSTPYILSFNVTKTRNAKSTFSASLKIESSILSSLSSNIISIKAGEKGRLIDIFTGYILSSRPSICFDDPNYTVLNISGADALYLLEGEKYTRRQINSKTKWAIIDGVTREATKGGQFEINYLPVQVVDQDMISKDEKRNKNKTTQDLSSLGSSNLPDGMKAFQFTYSAARTTEE
jgi:hypothetical protein